MDAGNQATPHVPTVDSAEAPPCRLRLICIIINCKVVAHRLIIVTCLGEPSPPADDAGPSKAPLLQGLSADTPTKKSRGRPTRIVFHILTPPCKICINV